MRIRRATIDDAPAIARVTVDTWKTAYRGIIDNDYLDNLSYAEREKGWQAFPFDNSFIYVAEDESNHLVGFAAAGPERESNPIYKGELYAIYIEERYQNKGIGSSLFQAVAKNLMQSGINTLLLWVLSDSPYRTFYEHHGGQPLMSRLLDMEGLNNQITAYGWLDIGKLP